jgi:hypothetical protein
LHLNRPKVLVSVILRKKKEKERRITGKNKEKKIMEDKAKNLVKRVKQVQNWLK